MTIIIDMHAVTVVVDILLIIFCLASIMINWMNKNESAVAGWIIALLGWLVVLIKEIK